jgi:N-carbamoyl-L-amino-acid hydrolase
MSSAHPRRQAVQIDEGRLVRALADLAGFGGSVGDGVARQTLTQEDLQARTWLAARFAGRPGYAVGIDDAANLHIRRLGLDDELPCIMTGSHVDTQPLGGWLDGTFGVMAGLEVLQAMDDADIRTQRSVQVVAWTNEEGSRFAPGLMGSQSYVQPDALESYLGVQDAQGVRFVQARDAALADFRHAAAAGGWRCFEARLAQPVHAYLEAHIEQGPVLEGRGMPLGVVQAIQGVRWYQVTVQGRSAHAGTTPLEDRDDAQSKSIALAHAVLRYAQEKQSVGLRVTIGRWTCEPGAINTIANRVGFTIDVRHPEASEVSAFDAFLRANLPPGAQAEVLQDKPTTNFDPGLIGLIRKAAQERAIPSLDMVSGAFHDAMPLAGFTRTAMLFAPSIKGISHHPEENTAGADLATCAQVLADCLLELAQPVPSHADFTRAPPTA